MKRATPSTPLPPAKTTKTSDCDDSMPLDFGAAPHQLVAASSFKLQQQTPSTTSQQPPSTTWLSSSSTSGNQPPSAALSEPVATPTELLRRFTSNGYSIQNHTCSGRMNPIFDTSSPPTSTCLHLAGFSSTLTSFQIEEHIVKVFDATVCPFDPILAGFLSVDDTSSWQMDCRYGRALCCARIRQLFIDGKSISIMGAVRLANYVILVCVSCNLKKGRSFGEGEEAEVDKILEVEDRKSGQPFFRDNYMETDSATLEKTFSTTKISRGGSSQNQKEAAVSRTTASARHILECNVSMEEKSEQEITQMVSGAVSTMTSFFSHVGAGNSGANWWSLLIGDDPAAKARDKRRGKAKDKGKGNGAAEEEEETEVVSLFECNSDTHTKLMEASKRFMGEVWFTQLTDAHVACGCGEECRRVRSANLLKCCLVLVTT
ncbi:hypothetical protein TrST_g3606 [Triparma strigata]|uniref:Uncharacterized protein n=1 Tax=Triparma strigata TaxID=1606541 RepID=A0A9W7B7G6_9STRA|nr:hypothetical protein TrST_g3606 [Triparma strigata]